MSENFNDKDKLTNEPKPERKVWDVEKGEYVDDTREDDDKMFGKESQSGKVSDSNRLPGSLLDKMFGKESQSGKVWDVEKGEYVDDTREGIWDDKKFDKKISN
jgi:hypothetical protein